MPDFESIKIHIKKRPTLKSWAFKLYTLVRTLEFNFKGLFKTYDLRRLHLGCGTTHLENFCNIDVFPNHAVDIIDNIIKLKKIKNNSAELIYSSHVLEHFSTADVPLVLKRWFDVLKPGGQIRLSVPDLDRIIKIYHKNWEHFQKDGHSPWVGLIYGGQENEFDFHKTGFNFNWLGRLLRQAGFIDIKEYPHEPPFLDNLQDASLAKEPFGDYISLNILATKPLN